MKTPRSSVEPRKPRKFSPRGTDGNRNKKAWYVSVLCLIILMVMMSSGCIENDRESIEEQYSHVNGKVREIRVEENLTYVKFQVMKLFGDYKNEAPDDSHKLEDGDTITIVYSEEKREEGDFPEVEKGDYLMVSIVRYKGESDFEVKYLSVTSHPYLGFYLSLLFGSICVAISAFFWKKYTHSKDSLPGGVQNIFVIEKKISDELRWKNEGKRNGFFALLLLFVLLSPFIAAFMFQFFMKTFLHKFLASYSNIFVMQLVLFLLAAVFLFLVLKFLEQERIIKTAKQRRWMFETFLGIIIIFQVLVQMFIYSIFIAAFSDFFSDFVLEGYPERDLDFYEVFFLFLPGWLMILAVGLFLTFDGGFRFHRQLIEDNTFTEEHLEKWVDPETEDGCEAFGEFDEEDESCMDCRESSLNMYVRCRMVSKPPGKKCFEDWECDAYGVEYGPDDETCRTCGKENPRIWYWCRKRSLEEQL